MFSRCCFKISGAEGMFFNTTRKSEDLKNSVFLSEKSWIKEEVASTLQQCILMKARNRIFPEVRTAAILNFASYLKDIFELILGIYFRNRKKHLIKPCLHIRPWAVEK